jgi:heparosan-N-sulfate-glucuronate 5-epimerase
MIKRISYLKRIFVAYVLGKNSQLTFWHDTPEVNEDAFGLPKKETGPYFMLFHDKASYPGPFDEAGIPLLDYHGSIGKQYNPIAIAQYGLGSYNLFLKNGEERYRGQFLKSADWLVNNLLPNEKKVKVWNHNFDWEYFSLLKAPWYSALAQGQGISLLLRAYRETSHKKYIQASEEAYRALITEIDKGGVLYKDDKGCWWMEEYLVDPPSHILNGFIWASWGVYDYGIATGSAEANDLFGRCIKTISDHLEDYDTGYWSLYDLSDNFLRTMASRFYHDLHITQLDVLYRMTGQEKYRLYRDRWAAYKKRRWNILRAFVYKCIFKLFYY